MSSFSRFCVMSLILLATVNTVFAKPSRQTDYAVITAENVADLDVITVLENESFIADIYLTPDARLASVTYDGLATIWLLDPAADQFGQAITSFTVDNNCTESCSLTSVGLMDNYLVVGNSNGTLTIYHVGDESIVGEYQFDILTESTTNIVTDIAIDTSERMLTATSINGVIVGSQSDTGEFSFIYSSRSLITNEVAVSHANALIATGTTGYLPGSDPADAEVSVWDINDTRPYPIPTVFELRGQERSISALEFNPDGSLLAVGDGNDLTEISTIRLFDTTTWELISTITLLTDFETGISFPQSLTFSPAGRLVAAKLFSGQILVWETETLVGDLNLAATTYTTFITTDASYSIGDIFFTPDGKFVVNGDEAGIQVWGIAE